MKKYSYVCMLSSEDYWPGVFGLFFSLQKVKSTIPLLVLINNKIKNLSKIKKLFNEYNIQYKETEFITTQTKVQRYNQVINFFQFFELIEYEKIIYLDLDVILYKNIDYFFEKYNYSFSSDDQEIYSEKKISTGINLLKPELNYWNYIIKKYSNTSFLEEEILYQEFVVESNKRKIGLLDIKRNKDYYHDTNIKKYWKRNNLTYPEEILSYIEKKISENFIPAQKEIDLIIPVYNTPPKLLLRCLSSITNQNSLEKIQTIIVDDCSTNNSSLDIIKKFDNILSYKYFKLEKNSGTGVARQYGIDHSSNKYIVFMDSDDSFNSPFAIDFLLNGIKLNENYQICIGDFEEIRNNGQEIYRRHESMEWVFGKIYKRSFLEKYNIKFHPTSRANEDGGFNTFCQLCADPGQINVIDQIIYCWCDDNKESITLKNNKEYSYSMKKTCGLYGFIENIKYAIEESQKVKTNNTEIINELSLFSLIKLYLYYLEIQNFHKEELKQFTFYCKDFYYFLKKQKIEFSSNKQIVLYNNIISSYHFNFIPTISFPEFIKIIQ